LTKYFNPLPANVPNNARKGQMGFNPAFKGLIDDNNDLMI